MHEIVVNLHMHTRYSDGTGTHREIALAALQSGLDAVIVTDHNVWVQEMEGYYRQGSRRVLLLVGQEVHDQARLPQKNHVLALGAGRDVAEFADQPQRLLDAIRNAGGLAFLAHIHDPAQPAIGEPDISWEDWSVQNFAGIELWNGMSEFKGLVKTRLHGLVYAFFPELVARAPYRQALEKWDELLVSGKRVVAIGGSDAHALHASLGPIRRTLFPYTYHFSAINTHLLLTRPLSGDLTDDRRAILEALAEGRAFVGYDLPASTRGFRFTAQGRSGAVGMGGEIGAEGGVTLQARLPLFAHECRLIKDGRRIRTWQQVQTCTHITTEPGVYRFEAYRYFWGCRRGWIYSNPIYIRSGSS